jgi:type IV pilus assembly protein PilY1
MFNVPSRIPAQFRRWFQLGLLAAAAGVVTLVVGQSAPPLINLSTEPLYMNGAKAKANLTIALSVEFPTVGQTYRDTFDIAKEYVGYFDSKSCYGQIPGGGGAGPYFDWSGKPNGSGSCGGGGFSGNFMNWATSSAIDILRYGLTGGNRVVDQSSGSGNTIVERAWLPDSFYRSSAYFSEKWISKAQAASLVETALFNKIGSAGVWIYNCRNRVYFAIAQDTGASSNCDAPFGISASGTNPNIVTSVANQNYYEIRNKVCDPNSATNRLMTYDPDTREWKGLCFRYPNGNYKPVGQFQMNSESLRVSVFSYLQDDSRARYGGVMRAPLKYLGARTFDQNFNLVGANPRQEWDANTGVFIENPQSGDATYGDQGYARSGATMYVNKFGTLNPTTIGKYKTLDPVSELYYEALRYLQGKNPTPAAISGLTGVAATDRAVTENYPAYRSWTNPFNGFSDISGDSPSCLRNSIVTIADVFTHSDRSVPGNAITANEDFARAAETNPTLDVPFWTSVVGGFESGTGVSYTDSMGRAQVTSNLASNTTTPSLSAMATMDTGATGGSYYMAGLSYWANTQTFNTSHPKARVKTFSIDVNESRASDDPTFRRTRQLYLAAKYGGYDDRAAGNTGNPYTPGSNALWQGSDGDAKNYFLVSDAKKFLDSLSQVFARVVEETGSIAGGAISTQRLTSSEAAGVFQARFNPVANYWSGRVIKYPLSLSADNSIVIGSTPIWEAGQVLTTATKIDYGVNRNIVIGPPLGRQGTDAPTPFLWDDLVQAHKDALNSTPAGVVDTLGDKRVKYLRGDQRDEISSANPTATFRPRDIVLGDIINSGLVYLGKPSSGTSGADYRTFYDANKSRKPVVFVNANDGMLHAFYDLNGKEAFAYVPGFLSRRLKLLPGQDYDHNSFADATPVVADAYFGSKWRTALVSGVGGGAQGVYALDVTNPETFTKNNALWEFTERDHPAMGNVIGTPQILKFRVSPSSSATPSYKWFAVVASGVNNYAPDGFAHTSGNPSLFFLDLGFVPTATQGWAEGTNFWRIELPQTSTTIAKGLVSFNSVQNFNTSAVDALYSGDLQGNLWKLDFSEYGTGSLVVDATANFNKFNQIRLSSTNSTRAPMYVAKAADGASLQPITGTPEIVNSYNGTKVVAFGTGKFLESPDTTVPLVPTASFYAVMDPSPNRLVQIPGRSELQNGTISTAGTVTVPAFTWGAPATTTPNVKTGWYVDLDASIGERQVSGITGAFGKLLFGTIYPTKGSCGEGGGKLYVLDPLTGSGITEESTVGILAPPLVLKLGSATLGASDTTGQRTATQKGGIVVSGSKSIAVSTVTGSESYQTGRLSWRQLNNYQAKKAAP